MSTEPDWTLYRTFLAVAKFGSLSEAARALGMTQPTIGRHIEALESALEVELFLRSPRGLSPTDVALRLLPLTKSMADTAATVLRTAASGKAEMAGKVRVSASVVMGVEWLPPILTSLRRAHPAIDIELVLSNDVVDLLAREADIAVRQTAPAQGALLAKKLAPTTVGLHAHCSYLERMGVPQSLSDLAGHDFIGIETFTPASRALLQKFPDLRQAKIALRTDNDQAQLAAIRCGLGIGFMQVGIAAREPYLVRVLDDLLSYDLPLWLVMHEDLKSSATCRTVFDVLVSGLSTSMV